MRLPCFSVVELDYLYLEKFPKDFRFYVIRNRGLELQNLANCIKYSRVNHRDLVALRDPNTKLEVTQRKNNNFDSEDNIMRALEGGYGDEFGF